MLKKLPKIILYLCVFVGAMGASAYIALHLMIKSVDTVMVPDLVGKDVVYALETLSGLGLNTKVSDKRHDAKVPENHVLFQEPEPGREIKKDRDVRIILSAGSKTLLMPDLVGMDLRSARIWLEENNLEQGWISRTYDAQTDKDVVLAQNPAASKVVKRNRRADFLVSMGKSPQFFVMPDFSGLEPDDAILIAQRWGLVVDKVFNANKIGFLKNVVIDQLPKVGSCVKKGDLIDITVNKPVKKIALGDAKKRGSCFIQYRIEPGFLKSHIELKVNINESLITLFDDYVGPGQVLWFLLPDPDTRFFLYRDSKPVYLNQNQYFFMDRPLNLKEPF